MKENDQEILLSTSRFLDQTCREFQLSLMTSQEVRDRFQNNQSIDECMQEALFG